MSYLKGFEHDIFFSYAHVDDAEDQWMKKFHDTFKLRINKYIGGDEPVKIWYDDRLEENQQFNSVIEHTIANSAIFIAFTSIGFYSSAYCAQELELFYEKANEQRIGLAPNGNSRIFNVQLLNKHHTAWPRQLQNMGAFKMFKDENEYNNNLGVTLTNTEDFSLYSNVMHKIAHAVQALLVQLKDKEINEQQSAQKKPVETAIQYPTEQPAKQIFIAKVTDTLLPLRKQIIKALESNNISVEDCSCPPPWGKQEHENFVRKKMASASLTLHLFDDIPGNKIADDYPYTFQEEQALIAKKLQKDQLIFIPQELDFATIDDEEHRIFLDNWLTTKNENDSYNLIREFSVPTIIEFINKKLTPRAIAQPANDCVLLDFHETDFKYIVEHYNLLTSQGKKIYMTTPGKDPLEDIKTYETALKEVTSVIIVGVTVAQAWLTERIRQIVRAIKTENSAIVKISIYNGTEFNYYVDLNKIY